MLSGLYPRDSGIIDNTWFDRARGTRQGAVSDADEGIVGIGVADDDLGVANDGPGVSPRQFLGTSLVGWLRDRDPRSQAVSISRKDRSAVLMAPEAEHVYWWHAPSGRFVTSTYYSEWLPEWVEAFNADDWLAEHLGGSWELLAPEAAYDISRPDDYPGERPPRSFGRVFPHPLPADRQALGARIRTTPYMDEATLDLGRVAISELGLGGDEVTDVLALSLSSTDSIGHAFGPFSREVQDQILQLDQILGSFLEFVEQAVGLERTLIVLTSDHGVVPVPEYSRELGEDAEGLRMADIYRGINERLGAEPDTRWFSSNSYGWIQVDRELASQRGVDADDLVRQARAYIETLDSVAAVFSRHELLEDRAPDSELEELVRRSFYAERSGDLYLVHQPLSQWQSGSASNHQSPYDYDRRVPLILRGPGIRPGSYASPAAVVDIAPTLARILGLTAPSGLEGRVLDEAIAR